MSASISTVDLDITVPYITVNPLLPDADINHVAAFLKSNANTKPMTTEPSLVNEITDSTSTLSFIRKYCAICRQKHFN